MFDFSFGFAANVGLSAAGEGFGLGFAAEAATLAPPAFPMLPFLVGLSLV